MNLLLSIGDWFAKNGMVLLIVVLLVGFIVMTFIRQKKESDARNELSNSITVGTKIVTTAGVYGTVESIEDTTDGKVVVIATGSTDKPSTMTIHINAIMGIDNKTPIVENKKKKKVVEVVEEIEDLDGDEEVEVIEKKVQKKSTKK